MSTSWMPAPTATHRVALARLDGHLVLERLALLEVGGDHRALLLHAGGFAVGERHEGHGRGRGEVRIDQRGRAAGAAATTARGRGSREARDRERKTGRRRGLTGLRRGLTGLRRRLTGLRRGLTGLRVLRRGLPRLGVLRRRLTRLLRVTLLRVLLRVTLLRRVLLRVTLLRVRLGRVPLRGLRRLLLLRARRATEEGRGGREGDRKRERATREFHERASELRFARRPYQGFARAPNTRAGAYAAQNPAASWPISRRSFTQARSSS
jgi:hypothetical protein